MQWRPFHARRESDLADHQHTLRLPPRADMPSSAYTATPLNAGAVWRGSQTSGQATYDVEVRICGLDEQGDVAGVL